MSKLSYFLLFFISFTIVACDNVIPSSQVPSVVKNTFKNHFPNASGVEWEILNDDYEVSFNVKTIDHIALLDSSGNLVKYKYEIDKTQVPNSIKSFLEREAPGKKWEDAEYVIDGNSRYYQLERDGFFNDKKLVVDSVGKLLPNISYWN